MLKDDFSEKVKQITSEDNRYDMGAYYFIRQALDYTVQTRDGSANPIRTNHVSGQELLDGVRRFALDQFGPMTVTVFLFWGIRSCSDFGEIVFNLVEEGILGKNEQDKKGDFSEVYDFEEAFLKPFRPKKFYKIADSKKPTK